MSYRMHGLALGEDWLEDPADCVDAGGEWNDETKLCNAHGPRCLAAGGTWNAETFTCTLPDGTVVDMRAWCAENERHWDPKHQLCFDPISEDACKRRGGSWDGKLCHRDTPATGRALMTRAQAKTLAVAAGVVVVGALALRLSRSW